MGTAQIRVPIGRVCWVLLLERKPRESCISGGAWRCESGQCLVVDNTPTLVPLLCTALLWLQ